jgi:NAD(P)-dependent dehydrogenase (short-subunit alcohol dehydrogenase family)
MAGLATFLAGDDARYITGQVIVFDGGASVRRPSLAVDEWRRAKDL